MKWHVLLAFTAIISSQSLAKQNPDSEVDNRTTEKYEADMQREMKQARDRRRKSDSRNA